MLKSKKVEKLLDDVPPVDDVPPLDDVQEADAAKTALAAACPDSASFLAKCQDLRTSG